MSEQKAIVFSPEAAFGPALNSVGIAQACQELGHKPVFVVDMGMAGVFEEYGFEERPTITRFRPSPRTTTSRLSTSVMAAWVRAMRNCSSASSIA